MLLTPIIMIYTYTHTHTHIYIHTHIHIWRYLVINNMMLYHKSHMKYVMTQLQIHIIRGYATALYNCYRNTL